MPFSVRADIEPFGMLLAFGIAMLWIVRRGGFKRRGS